MKKSPNTVGVFENRWGGEGRRRTPRRPPPRLADTLEATAAQLAPAEVVPGQPGQVRHPLRPLVREWLLDLHVLGRSEQTIRWYEQKIHWYLDHGGAQSLEELTAYELKRFLADRQAAGLSENTVHHWHETLKAFGNWASREDYAVDAGFLRVRAPRVSQKEMETYSADQLQALFRALPAGWPLLAVQILLGTGMRVGELCALTLTDFEDDDEASFLKVQRGKGPSFAACRSATGCAGS